jgi:hypothetical protein
MDSHFGYSTENFPRPISQVRVTDFFGHVAEVRQLEGSYPFSGLPPAEAGGGADADRAGGGAFGAGGEGRGADACSAGAAGSGACGWAGGVDGSGGSSGGSGGGGGGGSSSGSGGGGGGGGDDGDWDAGRLRGRAAQQPAVLDGLTLGGLAGLAAAIAAASLAWGDGPARARLKAV